MSDSSDTRTCAISGKTVAADDCIPCQSLRPSLMAYIRKKHPDIAEDDCIARDLLPGIQAEFVEDALSEEIGEITGLERSVNESLRENEILSVHPDEEDARTPRTGCRETARRTPRRRARP